MIAIARMLVAPRAGLARHRRKVLKTRDWLLRRLVANAYRNVPYYRALFDEAGIKPHHIRSLADLHRLPVTTRPQLQAADPDELVARRPGQPRFRTRRTSGSSGRPLVVHRSYFEQRLISIFRARAAWELGLRPRDRLGSIGMQRPRDPAPFSTVYFVRKTVMSALGIGHNTTIHSHLPPEEMIDRLIDFRATVMTGYPGTIARLAEHVEQGQPEGLRLRVIITGGEVLTPEMRRLIARAFDAEVYDTYNCHELGTIAWECVETGEMHVSDDSVALEILRDGRPAEPGERGVVVGTNLLSYTMPFLRYELGDIVTRGDDACACGRPFSTIRAIQGRMIDFFRLPDRVIHPYELLKAIRTLHWARHYQLLQETERRIVLRAVPAEEPAPEVLRAIERAAAPLLGEGVDFVIRTVPEIDLDATGKFRVSRSLVRSDYDGIDWDRVITSGPDGATAGDDRGG